MIHRRDILLGSLALCGAAAAGETQAGALGASTWDWLRLTADLSGRTTWGATRGDVWGFLPQADDLTTETFARRLYGYWSLVARKAKVSADGTASLRLKGWTFYLDPDSGAIVSEIHNPYTGQMVSCPPLSGPAATLHYGDSAAPGAPVVLRQRRLGPHAWLELDRISRFKPADITWFKLEADMTTFACRAADIDNPHMTHVPNTVAHNLVAEWQTWMHMHGAPGHILFKGDGAFVTGPGEVPQLQAAIDARFPGTLAEVHAWSAP